MLRKGDTLLFTVASKKISRNKSNQKGKRTQQLKLQISEEKKWIKILDRKHIDIPYSSLKLKIMKLTIQKAIYRFNTIQIKIPTSFLQK